MGVVVRSRSVVVGSYDEGKVSSFDDRHDEAREVRLAAQVAASDMIDSVVPPAGVGSVAFWKHLKSSADEQYWAAIEALRDDGVSWEVIAMQMETTSDSARTHYHARRRRLDRSTD